MSIKIYTKTNHQKVNDKHIAKMYRVIEAPAHQLILSYTKEFEFIRHESTKSLRPSKKDKTNK